MPFFVILITPLVLLSILRTVPSSVEPSSFAVIVPRIVSSPLRVSFPALTVPLVLMFLSVTSAVLVILARLRSAFSAAN